MSWYLPVEEETDSIFGILGTLRHTPLRKVGGEKPPHSVIDSCMVQTYLPAPITPTLTTFMDKGPRVPCFLSEEATGKEMNEARDLSDDAPQDPADPTFDVSSPVGPVRRALDLTDTEDTKASQVCVLKPVARAKAAMKFAAEVMVV